MNWALILILVCVCLGVAGELLFKTGALSLKNVDLTASPKTLSSILGLLGNPVIIMGFVCYGIASVLWIIVLSRLDLSFAYPVYALMFALIPLAAFLVFKEQIPVGRWIGILLIVMGIITVLRVGNGA
jgi:multidrug transporter EmrE-like cation transporter